MQAPEWAFKRLSNFLVLSLKFRFGGHMDFATQKLLNFCADLSCLFWRRDCLDYLHLNEIDVSASSVMTLAV